MKSRHGKIVRICYEPASVRMNTNVDKEYLWD